jgi:hypothetical protein
VNIEELPNLPKKKQRKEAQFQERFSKWLKSRHGKTGAFELKVSEGNSIPFNALADHQKTALYQVKHSLFSHKIADLGNRNPFDCFMLSFAPAWVVVMFHKPRQDQFYMCDIDAWCEEERISDRKSLTEDRAKLVCVPCSFNN